MILVSRLNREKFYVNCDLIEFVEQTPDTVISMASGRKIVVLETCEEIRQRIVEYQRLIYAHGYLADQAEVPN